MASYRLEVAAAAAFLVLAAAGWYLSADLPEVPRMFPRLVLALLGLSAALWLVGAVRRAVGAPAHAEQSEAPERSVGLSLLAVLGLTFVYAAAVITSGFFVPTVLYIPLMARLLGYRSWPIALAAAVAYTVVAYLLFVILFERPVPF